MNRPNVVLIDGADHRRARICELIEGLGHWVADYSTPAEFDRRACSASLYLIADESRMLQSMTVLLSRFDRPAYVIAYRPDPAVHDIVEAMKTGAADYLAWPFGAAAIRSRLTTAGSRAAIVDCGPARGRGRAMRPSLLTRIGRRLRATTPLAR